MSEMFVTVEEMLRKQIVELEAENERLRLEILADDSNSYDGMIPDGAELENIRWIPVTERLPEINQRVLTRDDDLPKDDLFRYQCGSYYGPTRYHLEDGTFLEVHKVTDTEYSWTFTHWMPIPRLEE